MVTKRAMAAATRAEGDEEGNGEGGECDGDAYKEADDEEEGECKGGESDGNGEEDGEGDKGDGDGDKEGNAFPYLGCRKSQITNLRLRLTNANEIWECSICRGRSKRAINVQIGRRNCKTSKNKQESLIESKAWIRNPRMDCIDLNCYYLHIQ